MAGKSRQSANLTSKNNIFVDTVGDNTGIGTTSPKSKLDILGNVNVTGILTVGVTSSVTIDGNTGIVSAAIFYGDGSALTNITGGGASSRTIVSGITTALVVNGIGNTEISGFKTYGLLKVGVSSASWVRLYTDSISRSNDANRPINIDPTTGIGLIAEVATAGISTVKITPFVIGFNDDNPVTNTIYISVKNLSGITTNISFDLTILKLED